MPDNLIQVGAVVDLGQYKAGMTEITATTENTMREVEASFVKHGEGAREAMHAMGLSAEATGVTINRHMRSVINELPLLSKAFEMAFPVFAATAGVEIIKQFGEKLSDLISDTFIFTEAEKQEAKALISANQALDESAKRVKQLGREYQLASATTAAEKERLRLQFKLEDLGGDPAALRAKLQDAIGELAKARAEADEIVKKGIDFGRPEEGTAVAPDLAVQRYNEKLEEAKGKVSALENQILALNAALKESEGQTKLAGVALNNIFAEQGKKSADLMQKAYDGAMREIRRITQQATDQMQHDELSAIQKENQAIIKHADDVIAAYEIQEEAAKAHEEALRGIATQRLDFERQLGKISEGEYERQLAAQLQASYQAARQDLENKRAAAEGNLREQARIDAEIKRLDDQYRAQTERADQQSFLRRRQQFDQYFKQISGAFTTALNGWIAGTETAAQAFSQMFQQIISDLLSFVERWIEKKIEMWLMDKLLSKQQATSDIGNSAGRTFAAAFADMASLGPEGLAVAPGVAAGAAAAVTSGSLSLLAASSLGGDWMIDSDRLNFVHKGETILPPAKSQKLDDMLESGSGGGNSFHFSPSVQVWDAAGVDRVLSKHQRLFEQRVDKILKRRRLA